MTPDARVADMVALGQIVRARIKDLILELDSRPEELGPIGLALTTWRVVILTLVHDISGSALLLCSTQADGIRALTILNRSLYEYAVHLEYYAHERVRAVRDWHNSPAWLKVIVRDGITAADLRAMLRDERQAYNAILRFGNDFEFENFHKLLRGVLKRRGLASREVKRRSRLGGNFYTIASSLAHGSQGAFYDVLEPLENEAKSIIHFSSFRLKRIQTVRDTVHYIIWALFAESLHRGTDLAADMHWRELELSSGI